MSRHNLLDFELETIKGDRRPPLPKPRRRTSTSEHDEVTEIRPKPKPRRQQKEEGDDHRDAESFSSVSSAGDHADDGGYKNPAFQGDGESVGDEVRKARKARPRKTGKAVKVTDDFDSSSEDDFQENKSITSVRSTPVHAKSSPEKKLAKESSIEREPDQKKKGHVTISVEEGNKEDANKDVKKSRIGGIFKKFLSRSTSKGDEPEKKTAESVELAPSVSPIERPISREETNNVHESPAKEEKRRPRRGRTESPITALSDSERSEIIEEHPVHSTPKKTTSKPEEKTRKTLPFPSTTKLQEKFLAMKSKRQTTKKPPEEEPVRILSPVKPKPKVNLQEVRRSSSSSEEEDSPLTSNRRKVEDKSPDQKAIKKKPLLLGVTVHGADQLPLDENLLHPVVKVTILSEDGSTITKSQGDWWLPGTSRDDSTNRQAYKRKSKRNTVDTISPVMTQPFKFKFNSNSLSLAPNWNELILFEEPFDEFIRKHNNAIFFFEIMDFLTMDKTDLRNDGVHGNDIGWYKTAWAFLKPVGANGSWNTGKMLRLQLFKPLKLRRREVLDGPEVYSWWKSGRRVKLLNTTLYVTVKGVSPPLPATHSPTKLRQLMTMRKEQLTDSVIESQLEEKEKKRKRRRKGEKRTVDARRSIVWARLPGQSCKVPNKLVASLPSSPIDSVSLTVSGNVHCLKFSPCGLKLAAGLDTEDLHAVLLFDIPSGNLLKSLKSHHGLIYDLSWTEIDNDSDYFQYLVSASADATSCVWEIRNSDESTLRLIKILHHPSFVYAAQFHPTHKELAITGCFDFIIRVWKLFSGEEKRSTEVNVSASNLHTATPLFLLDTHSSFVNCLTFNLSGTNMYSGDGDSYVFKWDISLPTKKRSWQVEREQKFSDTRKTPVNSLSLHPNGVQLLIHLRDNSMRIVDTSSFVQLATVRGITNDRLQIKSCFSPCGNLIFSGNEEPSFCIWDSDTYSVVDFVYPKDHPRCCTTCIDYHPHDFFVAVGLASGISEPSPVLLYKYDSPKLSQLALVQTGIAKFKAKANKGNKKEVTFASTRSGSTEKFRRIIEKLDATLKDAHEIKQTNAKKIMKSVSIDCVSKEREVDKISRSTSDNQIAVPEDEKSELVRKKKSPRSHIESKLEELIIPSHPDFRHDSPSELEDPTHQSEESIPSVRQMPASSSPSRQRPQSSRIPVRHSSTTETMEGLKAPSSVPTSPNRLKKTTHFDIETIPVQEKPQKPQ